MGPCETCQLTLSAFLDGEASGAELREALDHLAGCPACRAFYQAARRLEEACWHLAPSGAIRPEPAAAAAEAPLAQGEIPRADLEPGRPRSFLTRLGLQPAWTWAAAAVALVAVLAGGWDLIRRFEPASGPQGAGPVAITLGEERGRMDDDRFVAMAVELLKADSRYREEMRVLLEDIRPPQADGGEVVWLASGESGGPRPIATAADRREPGRSAPREEALAF